jgi:hypothetical protein
VNEGVSIETITPLGASDSDVRVILRGKNATPVTISDVKNDLSAQVAFYVEPMQERAAAQQEALEAMFQGRDKKPEVAPMENKRFEVAFKFVKEKETEETGETEESEKPAETEAAEGTEGTALEERGVLFVYALEPQNFFIKHIWAVREAMENVVFSVTTGEAGNSVKCSQNETPLEAWRKDPEIGDQLDAIQIQDLSARDLLFSKGKKRPESPDASQ